MSDVPSTLPPVAILLSNYNMPEKVDELVAYFERTTKWPYDLVVVDNGSERMPASRHTTLHWAENVGPAGVWPVAVAYARRLARKRGVPHLGYLVCCTSATIPEQQLQRDLVTPLAELLLADANAVFAHPAHALESETSHRNMRDTGSGAPRPVGFAETLCGLVRADWYHEIGGFDPEFYLHWGLDIDLCCRARAQGRGVWIHEGVLVAKEESRGYRMGRYEMTEAEREERSGAEMNAILSRKYGKDAWELMTELRRSVPAPKANPGPRRLGALRKLAWRLRAGLR